MKPARRLFLMRIAVATVALGIANFIVFVAISEYLGGDAVNGKLEHGRYFVGGKDTYTEVSRPVWLYSKAHVIGVWVTHALVIVAMLLIGYLRSQAPSKAKRVAPHC